MKRLLLLSLCFIGCGQCPQSVSPHPKTEMHARLPYPMYRAHVPPSWKMSEPEGDLGDTRVPICSFDIETIHIAVHTFPSQSLEERIPPMAQVSRWERQLSPVKKSVTPITHGGFVGLLFAGESESDGWLAWSLQLDPGHYQTLAALPRSSEEEAFFTQMRADVTIKATGPKDAIARHRADLITFADSFELIQEIP